MGMSGFVDVLFLGSGIYLIYTACIAKRNGTITANVMLDKSASEKNIKDKPGYIEYMYKRILIVGALIVLAGMINLVNDYYISSIVLNWVGIIMILAAIILYVITYKNGQKQYMEIKAKMKKTKSDKK